MDFIRTLIIGIKQGAIAAWYDLKWYIIIMGTILILAVAYNALKTLLRRK
jgi:hypothetical protein